MFRKIHSIFHPKCNRGSLSDGIPPYDGYAVRLIRSTSMYALGDQEHTFIKPLKKSKSITSLDSVAYLQLKEEKAWMYSKTQDCLQYLQDLLALRKKYLEGIKDLKALDGAPDISPLSTTSSKTRKTQVPPPHKETSESSADKKVSQLNSDVTEAIAYFDSIIAELDAERHRKKIVRDHPHADVDFDVVSSSREHSLHSNWILRAPRKSSQDAFQETVSMSQFKGKSQVRTISPRKKLQRYPMYLPKAVEGAFSTMKIKPKVGLKKQH